MSREAKKRILESAARWQEQQASGPPKGDVEAARGSDVLWPTCFRLQSECSHLEKELSAVFDIPASAAEPEAQAAASGKKYKWSTSLDSQFKFDAKQAYMRRDIYNIDWHEGLKGVQRSAAGAEGVFFVETSSGALVVKGSRNLASESFASMLALRVGVYCPPWRIITMANAEGQSMLHHLNELDSMGRVATNIGSQTHVVLKAFVAGRNLDAYNSDDMQHIFTSGGAISESGQRRLSELSRLLLLDVLINNGDRLPLIHDNRGNPGNVMLCRGSGQVIAIDSAIASINKATYPEQYQAYLDRVGQLCDGLVASCEGGDCTKTVTAPFENVRSKLLEFTGFGLSDEGLCYLQDKFLEAARSMHANKSINRMELRTWRQLLSQFDPPLVGMDWISVDFVMDIWNVIEERLAQPEG
eukprot:m.69247 g.69247  ORF g.69247 m.69247 type:complete len:414 (-) comp14111_c0_seq1:3162-4403(-)